MSSISDTRSNTGETIASFRIDGRRLIAMIRDGVVQPDRDYKPLSETALLTIGEDSIEVRAATPGYETLAHCTYDRSRLKDVDLSSTGPVHAVFDIDDLLEYYDFLATGLVDITLEADAQRRLPHTCHVDYLPNLEIPLVTDQSVFTRHAFRPEDHFGREDPQTVIKTPVENLGHIMSAIDKTDAMDAYPLDITDGEIKIDLTTTDSYGRTERVRDSKVYVEGSFEVDEIHGPDLHVRYPKRPFKLIARRLSGQVELRVTPSGTLEVVPDREDVTKRYRVEPI